MYHVKNTRLTHIHDSFINFIHFLPCYVLLFFFLPHSRHNDIQDDYFALYLLSVV